MSAVPNKPEDEAEKPPVPEADVKMTIWEHLDELRRRLVRSAIAVFITTCVAWAYKEQILKFLLRPYIAAWHTRHLPGAPELQGLAPGDIFMGFLELSLVTGVIASVPIISISCGPSSARASTSARRSSSSRS